MFAKGHKSEMFPNDHKMFTKDIAPRSGLTENVRKRIQIRNVHKRSQNVHKRILLPDLDSNQTTVHSNILKLSPPSPLAQALDCRKQAERFVEQAVSLSKRHWRQEPPRNGPLESSGGQAGHLASCRRLILKKERETHTKQCMTASILPSAWTRSTQRGCIEQAPAP